MGQLFNRIKNFINVTVADATGDLDRAQRTIDAEDDELRRIIDELRNGPSSRTNQAPPRSAAPGAAPSVPHDVVVAASVLGVPVTSNADVVKRAYRSRIAAVHPDRMAGRTPAEQQRAEEEAKAVNAAYDTMQRYLGIA
ncbi:MAG: hypothetical protein FGM24_05040 [Candidatus Kapabacteria bacterium]|nr:hypothetical protein [Candidatus Kapabacteria bacterium]